jgi:ubiquinone/menaquinone biosynthesis C-methylase UbiE
MHGLVHLRGGNRPAIFQGRNSRVYDFVARRLARGFYRRLADDVAAVAPQDGAVLDVGTGPGVFLIEIARRRPDLTLAGIDLSADMVAAARRNATTAEVQVGNVTELPFPDATFDLVVSSLSLHHWDDPGAAAPELARVLRPGGRLHIYDFRFAPFDTLVEAARTRSVFTGGGPERAPFRTGVPLLPRCVRFVMST